MELLEGDAKRPQVNHAGIQRKLLAEKIVLTTRQSHWPLLLKHQKEIPGISEIQKPNPESINFQAAGGARNAGGGWKKTPDHPKPDAITCYRCEGPGMQI